MATVFWNVRGIIHIDYLEKGKTINAQYYSNLLDRFDADLKAKKKILFHQDNEAAPKAIKTMSQITELQSHPPYSPDMAPCDYYLFPDIKSWLAGKFYSNEEVIAETNAYFEEFSAGYNRKGIELVESRWNKCIELEGNYVEE